jgi:hypothetical protein
LPASNVKHVKWGNSNEQISIEKTFNWRKIILMLFVNTEPPWLGETRLLVI